ncbi:MAG: NAD(P)-dependent glycerol-3-phosphate dehydrogenase, partial [Firmicutes bacterium]|nr:NAD(P)-dependent glycerol-3-phosphate dehydrogenase [Bacillota bacterium]
PYLTPGAILVSAAKGLELESWKRMSEVIAEEIPGSTGRIAVLSGPNHAEEVGRGVPSATVVASDSPDAAREVREAFGSLSFRVYTSPDLVGVELGGAFKNIIALACGIAEGLGLGDNTRAALMTRGLAEVARLGVAMGGRAETFAGLSGVGDLIVTCTSGFSRNRRAGVAIGRGRSLAETLEETRMVVEGVFATQAARALSELYQVEMPIARETYAVLFEGKNPQAAVRDLMIRPPADEITWLEEVPPARRPS